MASTATVGTLNVEVALQLAKLQGDFDRMQGMVRNQTKASNRQFKEMGREGAAQLGSLRAEIEKTSKELGRKFSAGKLFEGVLGGFGVGSGAALVQTVFSKFQDAWRESAAYAKEIDERATSIGEKMRGLSESLRADFVDGLPNQEKLLEQEKDILKLRAQADEASAKREQALADVGTAGKMASYPNRLSGATFDGRYGPETRFAKEFGDLALSAADQKQKEWTDLSDKIRLAEKARQATEKEIDAEKIRSAEQLLKLGKRLEKAQAAYNAEASSATPRESIESMTEKVENLARWLEVPRDKFVELLGEKGELEQRITLLDDLTESTRKLGEMRQTAAAAGEKAADDALRVLRDREKLEQNFQEAMNQERQAVIDTKDRRNAGAGLLGQNAREGAAQSIERQQLTVLQRIEQLLSRSPQVATPGAINLPRGFTF